MKASIIKEHISALRMSDGVIRQFIPVEFRQFISQNNLESREFYPPADLQP